MPKYSTYNLQAFNAELFSAMSPTEARRFRQLVQKYGRAQLRHITQAYVNDGVKRTGATMDELLRVAQEQHGGPRMTAYDLSVLLNFTTCTAIVRAERPYMEFLWPEDDSGEE